MSTGLECAEQWWRDIAQYGRGELFEDSIEQRESKYMYTSVRQFGSLGRGSRQSGKLYEGFCGRLLDARHSLAHKEVASEFIR